MGIIVKEEKSKVNFMQGTNFKRTKFACYSAYFTMSSVFSLPPLLFMTFHDLYGISYTLLGTLILANFITQLSVDLIFTFFTKHFNVEKIIKIMPLITSFGLFSFAILPWVFPSQAFLCLLISTIVFSVASGLSEVLLSPVIAAIPSDNPKKDMSLLHSLYAFGVFFVVIITTIFLRLFGNLNWMYLTMFFAVLPIVSSVLFFFSPMPKMNENEDMKNVKTNKTKVRSIGLALCFICIFLGACVETNMTSWVSTYVETALQIDKTVGDIVGIALFAILLGLTRIWFANFGKNIIKMLLVGMIGATICYLIVGFSPNSIVSLIFCVLTGIFVAMLWPGTLIMMEERIPHIGVAAFALMAAGGDFGAAVAPQVMGLVIDGVAASSFASELGLKLGISAEQIGLKAGMIFSAIFSLLGIVVVLVLIKFFKKNEKDLLPLEKKIK